jgi:hypothetical protein
VAGFGRLEDGLRQAGEWHPDGEAWDYLPHDHARSRAYRWGEDGLAGFCDIEQRLCLGLALWNGRDPILQERAFGLTGAQGNHGEDVKDNDLIAQNAARSRQQPEYELIDTGAFDDGRYWIVEVQYAKASPDDLLMAISVTNAGPDAETLHVGSLHLIAGSAPDRTWPAALFCDNETNVQRLFGAAPVTPYPKDGINDHVVGGAPTVNPGWSDANALTVAPYLDGSDDPDRAADGTWLLDDDFLVQPARPVKGATAGDSSACGQPARCHRRPRPRARHRACRAEPDGASGGGP